MVGTSTSYEGVNTEGIITRKAEIVRSEIMFGNIRIRCPVDGTEHEVPEKTKEFICPVSNEVLLL